MQPANSSVSVISLNEIEGERDSTDEFVFLRIGSSIPLSSSSFSFDFQSPPSQPLSISNRHGLLFISHPQQGFIVVKTNDVIAASKEIKEDDSKELSVEDVCVMDVKIGSVEILAVSDDEDESLVAAAVGDEIFFYKVASLLSKMQEPAFSSFLSNSATVKDFKWQKKMKDTSFVVLSTDGLLYQSISEAKLNKIMDGVDAVDWSREGDYIAVARKHSISVLSSDFNEILNVSLIFECWQTLTDPGGTIIVDSIKWLLDDSIILGCHQVDEDGAEEGYLIQVIKRQKKKFLEIPCNPIVYSFSDLFDGVWDILPSGSGPYLLANYLAHWGAVLMSNKKAIDQHISLLKWSSMDDNNKVVALELISDKYTPKIEVPVRDDDNLIFGFCVGTASAYEKIDIKVDENVHELFPPYALFCLTSEGKLILFHAARISEPTDLHQTLPHLDGCDVVERRFNTNLLNESIAKPVLNGIQLPTSKDEPKQINVESSDFEKGTFELPGNTIPPCKQQAGTISGQTGKLNNLFSDIVNSGDVENSVVSKGAFASSSHGGATVSYFGSESTNKTHHDNQNEAHQDSSFSIFHLSSQLASGKEFTVNSQPSSFSEKSSHKYKENLGNSFSMTRDANSSHTLQGSVVAQHEDSLHGKLDMSTAQSLLDHIRASKSQDNTKQFYNVKDMTEELDILLSYIEKEGGFKDACTSYQENSVHALEDDLLHLSERSHNGQKSMEEQLMDIQQLQNMMLQVSARQSYMKGIVELTSNKTYWDIWNRQKLDPQFEVKQKNILNANQNLIREIIELERHFNTLEINKFGDIGRSTFDHAVFRRSQVSLRQKPLLQSLYNAVHSQLSAAEQLSELLSRQMSNLNINSGSVEKESITQEVFESIGLSQEHNSFLSPPVCKRASLLPSSIRRTPLSTTNSLKGYSQRSSLNLINASEPETARRRRDSLDRNCATFKPPKTTVKRETPEKFSRVDVDEPFRKAKESFDAKKKDFESHQKRMEDNRSKQQREVGSNFIPMWTNDTSGFPPVESNSNQVVGIQRTFTLSPSPSHSFSTLSGTQSSTKNIYGTSMTSSTDAALAQNPANPSFANINSNTKNNSQMQNVCGQAQSSADFSSDISSINNGTITESSIQTSKNLEDSFSSGVKGSNSSSLSTTPAFVSNLSKNITAASQPNGPKSTSTDSPFKLPISTSFCTSSLASTTASTTPLTFASMISMSFGNSSSSGRLGDSTSSTLAATSASLSTHPISWSWPSSSTLASTSASLPAHPISWSSPSSSTFAATSASLPAHPISWSSPSSSTLAATSASLPAHPISWSSPSSSTLAATSASLPAHPASWSSPSSLTLAATSASLPAHPISWSSPSISWSSPSSSSLAATSASLPAHPISWSSPSISRSSPSSSTLAATSASLPAFPISWSSPSISWSSPSSSCLAATSASLPAHPISWSLPSSSTLVATSASLSAHPISSSSSPSSSSLSSTSALPLSSSSSLFPSSSSFGQPFFSAFTSSSPAPVSTTMTKPSLSAVSADKPSSDSKPAPPKSVTPEKVETSLPNSSSSPLPTNNTNMSSSVSQPQPAASSSITMPSSTEDKSKPSDANLSDQEEDGMDEEAPDTTCGLNLGSLSGFGIGSTTPSTPPKQNPFGGSFLTASSSNQSSTSSPFSLQTSPGQGELFRPASFTIPSAQLTQPSSSSSQGAFSGFRQTSKIGVGQQAPGSVLGSFGASRQIGAGIVQNSGSSSTNNVINSGFGVNAPAAAGGGFAAAAVKGGGFAAVASGGGGGFGAFGSGGGFSGAGSGSGFAGAHSGGGFGGSGSNASSGFGFAAANNAGGGFGAAREASGFKSDGFGGFGNNQGSGGMFSSFGGNNASSGSGKPPASLLTQMRK